MPFGEIDELRFAGPRAAFEQHVADLRDRTARRDIRKSAVAQDRGFKCELRRESGPHLLFRARRSGLVIENDVAAVSVALDAVGDAVQSKGALRQRNFDLAADLRDQRTDVGAPRRLPTGEPVRDPLETRPPEGARFGKIVEIGEMRPAKLDKFARGIGRKAILVALGEIADGVMDDGAALGRAGRKIDGIERRQAQNVFGIDGVGIAQPVFDVGDGKALRPRRRRRLGRRLCRRRHVLRPVECACP